MCTKNYQPLSILDLRLLSLPVLSCDANSTYSSCMSPCPASCADLAAPSECDTTFCVEGCQCALGSVMSEGICVPYRECGCTFLNRYYPVRSLWHSWSSDSVCHCIDDMISSHPHSHLLQLKEKFVTDDCSQSCECTSTGVVCQPKICQEGYICTVYNFKRDCFRGVCLWVFLERSLENENSFITV